MTIGIAVATVIAEIFTIAMVFVFLGSSRDDAKMIRDYRHYIYIYIYIHIDIRFRNTIHMMENQWKRNWRVRRNLGQFRGLCCLRV